ncbi:MAG TPA: cbb3-type cytochrome oxidase assembly protein CcoS [Caulobacter sp.]|nr:cbb3-type cytochrome oxidase assembly protein CcoS [Caulobacter sp.]
MTIVYMLAPLSLLLGLSGLAAFWWTLRSGQYEDPMGDAARILDDHLREGPDEE